MKTPSDDRPDNIRIKIEKKFFGVSFIEMIILTLFILLFVNILAMLAALVIGIPYLTILGTGWFLLIVYPVAHGVIQSLTDKNGMLIISGYDDFESLKKELQKISGRISYQPTETDEKKNVYRFNRGTRMGRIVNLLFREDYTMESSGDTVKIYGKRNTLKRIEKRFLYIHK